MSNKSFALTGEGTFNYSHLAINKSRLKEFNPKNNWNSTERTFYLSGDTEFQIEIFNPTNDTIGAKVFINNKAISSSYLVLYPGQRVWLERDFDSKNKFKFIIYEVEKNNRIVEKSITENGKLKIEFYKEMEKPVLTYTSYNTYDTNIWKEPLSAPQSPIGPIITCYNSSISYADDGCRGIKGDSGDCGACSAASTLSAEECLLGLSDIAASAAEPKKLEMKETGIVGRSSERSRQEFQNVNVDFEYFPFKIEHMQILPLSEKRITVEDLNVRRYCSRCGKKLKPNFKFCPACGTKVE